MNETKKVARMLSTKDYPRWSNELLDDIEILREIWPPLYTSRPAGSPHPCTASFKGTFARTSGRVRTSKTIVIVHISYAGQGLRCNSQEKAIPPTSIKKNQSAQDREAPLSYERHPTTAKQGTKVTDRSGENAGKATLSAMSSLGHYGVLIGM